MALYFYLDGLLGHLPHMCQNLYVRFVFLLSIVLVFPLQVHADEAFHLADSGTESIVRYDHYGHFSGVSTPQYQYYIEDREGLSHAVGEGVYPNVTSLLKDPAFQKMQHQNQLEGPVWEYVNSQNLQANFFKWSSNHDQPAGVKQFYVAMALEKAGLLAQAVQAV